MSALFPHQGRGTHISLVFREMWDTTAPSLCYSIHPMRLAVNIGGIPHLAKNQRDMGHPALVRGPKEKGTAFPFEIDCSDPRSQKRDLGHPWFLWIDSPVQWRAVVEPKPITFCPCRYLPG